MRVTDSMITELARSSVADARDRALSAQRVASTGIRVEKPSDDPTAAAIGRRKAAEQARVAGMVQAATRGKSTLDSVDDGLSHVDELLARVQELAIQAANDTASAQDRASLAPEVKALREQILAVANTRIDGKCVMGGMQQDVAPFDASGAFVGDRTVPTIEVAPGVRAPTSVSAGDVFTPAGGLDVLGALDRLATALGGNDIAGIRTGIDDVTTATAQVSAARGALGVSQGTMTMAVSLGEAMKVRISEVHANAVEADAYDAISALTTTQTALQQAVSIASRLPLPGLAQKG